MFNPDIVQFLQSNFYIMSNEKFNLMILIYEEALS